MAKLAQSAKGAPGGGLRQRMPATGRPGASGFAGHLPHRGSSALRPLRQALRAAFPDTPQVEGGSVWRRRSGAGGRPMTAGAVIAWMGYADAAKSLLM